MGGQKSGADHMRGKKQHEKGEDGQKGKIKALQETRVNFCFGGLGVKGGKTTEAQIL